jgi:hypothetical protein
VPGWWATGRMLGHLATSDSNPSRWPSTEPVTPRSASMTRIAARGQPS